MPRKPKGDVDDDLERARRHLDELLKDPVAFEKWANETLDMALRLRKR